MFIGGIGGVDCNGVLDIVVCWVGLMGLCRLGYIFSYSSKFRLMISMMGSI